MPLSLEVLAALKVLGLEPPITANALKTAFRRCSKLEHPDRSKHPQAKERFDSVAKANALLLDHTELLDSVDLSVAETNEGDELSGLGKGLGATINGTTCEECKGLGYRTFTSLTNLCQNCRPRRPGFFSSLYEYRCRKCLGSGLFKMKFGKSGTCYPCQGTGWVRLDRERPFHNSCTTCKGLGLVEGNNSKTYNTCSECKGAGEIPMWNPVLPKGFLSSFGR